MLAKLKKLVPRGVAVFIIWYFSDEGKRQPFDEWSQKNLKGVSYDSCMAYFLRNDTQEAAKLYMKETRTYQLMKIYYTMLAKANSGDVNAAKYCESFCSNGEFFNDNQDSVLEFMNKVQIPVLKKTGDDN